MEQVTNVHSLIDFINQRGRPSKSQLRKWKYYLFYGDSDYFFFIRITFSLEVCRVCESTGRVKIYFTPNTTHKCPHGGADKGTFSVWCMTHDWIYFFEIAKTSSWTMSKKRKELNLLRTRRSGEYLSFLECYLFFFLRFVKSVKERRRLSTSSRRKYLNIWGTVLITRRRRVTFVLQKLYYFYDETFTCTTRKRV